MGEDSSSDSEDERAKVREQRALLKRASQAQWSTANGRVAEDDAGDDLERQFEQEKLGLQLKAQEDLQRLAQQARIVTKMKSQASFARTRLAARKSISKAAPVAATSSKEDNGVAATDVERGAVPAAPGRLDSDEINSKNEVMKSPPNNSLVHDVKIVPTELSQRTGRTKLRLEAFALTEEDKIELDAKKQQRIQEAAADELQRARELADSLQLKSKAFEKEDSLKRSTSSVLERAEAETRARHQTEMAKAEEIRQLLAAQEDGLRQAGSESAERRAEMISKTNFDREELVRVRAEKEAAGAAREEARQALARQKHEEQEAEAARLKEAFEDEQQRLRELAEEAERKARDKAEAERNEQEKLAEAAKRRVELEHAETERRKDAELKRLQAAEQEQAKQRQLLVERDREIELVSVENKQHRKAGAQGHLLGPDKEAASLSRPPIEVAEHDDKAAYFDKENYLRTLEREVQRDAGMFRDVHANTNVGVAGQVSNVHTEGELENRKPEKVTSAQIEVVPRVYRQSGSGGEVLFDLVADGAPHQEIENGDRDLAADTENVNTRKASSIDEGKTLKATTRHGTKKAETVEVVGTAQDDIPFIQAVIAAPQAAQEGDELNKMDLADEFKVESDKEAAESSRILKTPEKSVDEQSRLAEEERAREEAEMRRRVAAARVQAAEKQKRQERESLMLERARLEAEIANLRMSKEAQAASLEETSSTARVLMAARELLGDGAAMDQRGLTEADQNRLLWGSRQAPRKQQLHILKERLRAGGGRMQIQGVGGVRWNEAESEVRDTNKEHRSGRHDRGSKRGGLKNLRSGVQSLSPRRHFPNNGEGFHQGVVGGMTHPLPPKHGSSPYSNIPAILSQGRSSHRFKRLVEMHKRAETIVVEASNIAAPHRRGQRAIKNGESGVFPRLCESKTVIRLAPRKHQKGTSSLSTDRTRLAVGREKGMREGDEQSSDAGGELPALTRRRSGA